jgi:hypothetical protein
MNQKLSFSIDQSKREESSGKNSESKIDRAFSRENKDKDKGQRYRRAFDTTRRRQADLRRLDDSEQLKSLIKCDVTKSPQLELASTYERNRRKKWINGFAKLEITCDYTARCDPTDP